jgi:hypothetical protein
MAHLTSRLCGEEDLHKQINAWRISLEPPTQLD